MMSRKVTTKQKTQDKEAVRSLIEKITSLWTDLKVTEANLTTPTFNFVYEFYSRFYFDFENKLTEIAVLRLNIEHQPNVEANKYSEEVSLSIKLRDLCKDLHVMPFCLSDMCDPQPKRTCIFFTIFMNLLLFISSNTDFLEELGATVKKIEYFQKAYDQKQDLLQKLQELSVFQDVIEQNLGKLSQSTENLLQEYRIVLLQKAEKDIEYQKDLVLITKFKENIKNANDNTIILKDELSLLQKQILDEAEIDKLHVRIKTLTEDLNNLDNNRTAILSALESQEQKTKEYRKCLETIKNSNFSTEYLEYIETLMDTVLSLCSETKIIEEEIADYETGKNKLYKITSTLPENIKKFENEIENLKSEAEKNEQKLRSKINNLSESVKRGQILCKSEEKNISEIEEKMSYLRKDLNLLDNGVMLKCSSIDTETNKTYYNFNNILRNIDNYLRNLDE